MCGLIILFMISALLFLLFTSRMSIRKIVNFKINSQKWFQMGVLVGNLLIGVSFAGEKIFKISLGSIPV